jgi:phage terminase large subunit-like protein
MTATATQVSRVDASVPTVRLKCPHPQQLRFLRSPAKRKIIRAGRRSGKTTGLAILAVEEFIKGRRVLYSAPTSEQMGRFWQEVSQALSDPILHGVFKKNETEHTIERSGTEQRIRAKTAWNADSLRGDTADLLVLDEYQLMAEDAWQLVGAPMLLDNRGDAVFLYTPPSVVRQTVSKAIDKRHAAKLFKAASADTSGRWATFTFTSHDNPHISVQALTEITQDMSALAYKQEILAEDIEDVPGALWTQAMLDHTRITTNQLPALTRVAIALDPAGTSQETSDEMGIVAGGRDANGHGYTLRDASRRGTPAACARQAILLYDRLEADVLIGETNNGGEWIGTVIAFVAQEMYRQGERPSPSVHYKMVHASRSKQTRAEPIATEMEHGRIHHVGTFPQLEEEMCLHGDTLITTADGLRPLASLQAGELVWTSAGLRPVLWSGCTQSDAEIWEITTADNMNLVGTLRHPVYHIGLQQFMPLGMLQPGDRLEVDTWRGAGEHGCVASMGQQGAWANMVSKLSGRDDSGDCDVTVTTTISEQGCFMSLSGDRHMVPLRRGISSTTKMKTAPIMLSIISNSRRIPSTDGIIGNRKELSQALPQEALVTKHTGSVNSPMKLCVLSVARPFSLPVPARNIAPKSVEAVCTGVRKLPSRAPVYNLVLPAPHDYYANGIRVHNCSWVPGMPSPSRLDAEVWCFTELLLNQPKPVRLMEINI